jgi:hypothetical protein
VITTEALRLGGTIARESTTDATAEVLELSNCLPARLSVGRPRAGC